MNLKFGKNDLFYPNNVFIIPDIHGEDLKLQALLKELKKKLKINDDVVFLGDLIGRGNSNLNTLQVIQDFIQFHPNTHVVMGNHDSNFINYMLNNSWLNNINALRNLLDPEILEEYVVFKGINKHISGLDKKQVWNDLVSMYPFLIEFIPYYETDDLLLTHAPITNNFFQLHGTSEGVLDQNLSDLMWNFVDDKSTINEIIHLNKWHICGHQNNGCSRLIPTVNENVKKVFLDTGVGYNKDAVLYCFDFNNKKFFSY